MNTTNQVSPSDLIPATAEFVVAEYPHLFDKAGQWSWLMRHRETNGLNHAIVAIGPRKLFLSRSRFAEWLANQSEAA